VKLQGSGGAAGRDGVVIDAHAGYEEAIYVDDTVYSPMAVEIHDLTISSTWNTSYMTGISIVGTCAAGTGPCARVDLYNTRVTGFTSSGIQVWGDTYLTCQNNTRIDNNYGYAGGGVASYGEDLSSGNINGAFGPGTVIENNVAYYGGGVYATGTFNIDGSEGNPVILRGNVAYEQGGGFYWDPQNQNYYVDVGPNVTFDSNYGAVGGGWYAVDVEGSIYVDNATYTNNMGQCAKYRYEIGPNETCVD
jgi:predicted outer membrane repeat protein